MVILSYYIGGIFATLLVFMFHNLIVRDTRKEFDIVQILVSSLIWPIIIPLAAIGGIWHYGEQLYRSIFKNK
jgi:hypothetical protein